MRALTTPRQVPDDETEERDNPFNYQPNKRMKI